MGGWKKAGGPLPKRGFGPPFVWYVFHPSFLCFPGTKIHDRADQKLFWRGPEILGRVRSLVRLPAPIRFAPPHIMARVDRFAFPVQEILSKSAVKQRGWERKGPPRNHPEISSRKVAGFECRFPYDLFKFSAYTRWINLRILNLLKLPFLVLGYSLPI